MQFNQIFYGERRKKNAQFSSLKYQYIWGSAMCCLNFFQPSSDKTSVIVPTPQVCEHFYLFTQDLHNCVAVVALLVITSCSSFCMFFFFLVSSFHIDALSNLQPADLKNEFFSRSGKSQGIFWMIREI